ncbi:MAG: hypothetical protein IT342_25840 [Candidatus Melainabacteria bacterium]|nr:hypothetical protein [Candidatus Melainabacteria bacterium]
MAKAGTTPVLVLSERNLDNLTAQGLTEVREALERAGYAPLTISETDTAIRVLKERQFDLIISTLTIDHGLRTIFDFLSDARLGLKLPPVMIVTIVQSAQQDEILSIACQAHGAQYLNLSTCGSDNELQRELEERVRRLHLG